jgi:predicted DNA-binding helix-hairpin-helix protein
MKIQQNISLMEKLTILSDAAKYDVACTSSGVDRSGDGIGLGKDTGPRSFDRVKPHRSG